MCGYICTDYHDKELLTKIIESKRWNTKSPLVIVTKYLDRLHQVDSLTFSHPGHQVMYSYVTNSFWNIGSALLASSLGLTYGRIAY